MTSVSRDAKVLTLIETSRNKSSGGIKRSGGQYVAIADEIDFNSKDLDSSESEESGDEVQVEVAEPVPEPQTSVPRSPTFVSYKKEREQARAELQRKKKNQRSRLEKKDAAKRQWQAEEDERNVVCFTDSFSLEPYECTAETRAELEDSMYDHKRRITFSHAITRRMTAERKFWGNDEWEEGPRNGQVNGVCYNKDSTATWEEVQAAERLAKQQPRRSRNNNRRKSKKLAKDLEI